MKIEIDYFLIVTAMVEYYPNAGTEIVLEVRGKKTNSIEIFYPDNSNMDRFHIDRICSYANVENVTELEEGKFIREITRRSKVIGYGHPTKDKFFLLNKSGEYTQEEIRRILK